MKATLIKYWERLRASYWFIPTIMVTLAIMTSFLTVYLDVRLGSEWLERMRWLEGNKPEGARALLSAVATSSITVAGVVFSITITSVSLASQQFGPRLLTNFMRDRKNQTVLGTFLATFTYSILVLRTIQDSQNDFFVPNISLITALFLTLASVGVLIFFIHHSADSLRATTVIARVGDDIESALRYLYPNQVGLDAQEVPDADVEHDAPPDFDKECKTVFAEESGYIQGVDSEGIMNLAIRTGLILKIIHRPGEFVFEGQALVEVWPGESSSKSIEAKLNRLIITDRQRSPKQDVLFLINELVEMAARALSSGVNDPFTAIGCIDHLSAACKRVISKDFPSSYRYDEAGYLRVIAEPIDFGDFAESAFGQLRPYATQDRNVAQHLLVMLAELIVYTDHEVNRTVLINHARLIAQSASEHLSRLEDQRMIREAFQHLLTRVAERRMEENS